MNHRNPSIFFWGSERVGTFLQRDFSLLEAGLPDWEPANSIEEASVVFSANWSALEEVASSRLQGKIVVCQFDEPPFRLLHRASFRDAGKLVSLWVAKNQNAARQAECLSFPCLQVPYRVDLSAYSFVTVAERQRRKEAIGIPSGTLTVGSFLSEASAASMNTSRSGDELLLQTCVALLQDGRPIHLFLTGSGRDPLCARLKTHGIPFQYFGEKADATDRPGKLMGALDLCLATTDAENALDTFFAACASGVPVVAPRFGAWAELLPAEQLFTGLMGARKVTRLFLQTSWSNEHLQGLRRNLESSYSESATRPCLRELRRRLTGQLPHPARTNPAPPRGSGKKSGTFLSRARSWLRDRGKDRVTVSIFREFVKPPYGGANQFMLALKSALEKKGVRVLVNQVGDEIDGYFFDSLWFDRSLLRKLERIERPVVVHRIDGPIHLYRGKDKEIDDEIFSVNRRLATSTVIQSEYTLQKVYECGYRPVRPIVIPNAANPEIFFPATRAAPGADDRIRLIATSWSDNPNKGGPVYKWLEERLDWSRFDFTMVGRCSEKLTRARCIPPVASEALAGLLREQDIYLTASQNDPCSNALIEAMSCGLPAIALRSGGHPELVGFGGACFEHQEEIPALLDELSGNLPAYRRLLSPPGLDAIADLYLRLILEP